MGLHLVHYHLQGQGGADCDFIATIAVDNHVILESALSLGSHIGVLPTGQLSDPAYTSKSTDASHFRVCFMVGYCLAS